MNNVTLFEAKHNQREELLGKLLYLYGSIPVSKQKSNIVIKKMLWRNSNHHGDPFFKLGEDVDLISNADQDKIRYVDYFDSVINSKETRGHNFEGTVAGLFNGKLSKPGEKWDVLIDEKTWSVKFIDNNTKAPEIGRYKKIIEDQGLTKSVDQYNGLTKIFKIDHDEYVEMLKEEIWDNVISSEITGGWIIAYPYKGDILIHIIETKKMRDLLMSGCTTSPKAGLMSYYSLALSSKYKVNSRQNIIKIPKLDIKELRQIYLNKEESEWSKDIFGAVSNKIRPDVLRYIKSNETEIGHKLLSYNKYKPTIDDIEWDIKNP